jgi:hypothetical protein
MEKKYNFTGSIYKAQETIDELRIFMDDALNKHDYKLAEKYFKRIYYILTELDKKYVEVNILEK